MEKKTKGRQKIEIVKMQNSDNLQVTFSKRRSGLFKKASELSTLCGVDMAVIISSPAGNVFSFGSPNVKSIVDRFLEGNVPESNQPISAHRNPIVSELNSQLIEVENALHAEKKRKKELDNSQKARLNMCWWENPIDQMSLEQIGQLERSLLGLRNKVQTEIEKARLQMSAFQNIHAASSSHARGGGGISFVQNVDAASSSHACGSGGILPFVQESDGASSSHVTGGRGTLLRDRTSVVYNSNFMPGYGPHNPGN